MGATPDLTPVWRRARRAAHRLLALDYDGTLVPFTADRRAAALPPSLAEVLGAIAAGGRTTVAIVSGRPVEELRRIVGPLEVRLIGEHGWEGENLRAIHRHPVPATAARALQEAARACSGDDAYLEHKRTGIVLHLRGLAAADAAALQARCYARWSPLAATGILRLQPIDGGLELRAGGRDKGIAIQELLRSLPAATLPVVLGDDLTDEDAFAAIRPRGVAIRIGDQSRPSAARLSLESPGAASAFLLDWLRWVEATPHTARSPEAPWAG
jgi:trehalose 6-phosphate phosphatase